MSIVVATMVKDEAGRYLRSALSAWVQFADQIVALDNASTDASGDLLRAAGAHVVMHKPRIWGDEARARKLLWNLALDSGAEWILFLDVDMVPASDPSAYAGAMTDARALAFRLYDLWLAEPPLYRQDGLWRAHFTPRVWAVHRSVAPDEPEWNERGIHCGHLPSNVSLNNETCLLVPEDGSLLHYGYAHAEDRVAKHDQYLSVSKQLLPQERDHAESILDPKPPLLPLPFSVEWPLQRGS